MRIYTEQSNTNYPAVHDEYIGDIQGVISDCACLWDDAYLTSVHLSNGVMSGTIETDDGKSGFFSGSADSIVLNIVRITDSGLVRVGWVFPGVRKDDIDVTCKVPLSMDRGHAYPDGVRYITINGVKKKAPTSINVSVSGSLSISDEGVVDIITECDTQDLCDTNWDTNGLITSINGVTSSSGYLQIVFAANNPSSTISDIPTISVDSGHIIVSTNQSSDTYSCGSEPQSTKYLYISESPEHSKDGTWRAPLDYLYD